MAQYEDLFAAAKAGSKDEFVRICKENVAYIAKHRIDENGNPFHIAASKGILLPALKEIIKYLEEDTKRKVEKAEGDKNWGESERLKEELKCNRKYIKDALCDKSYIRDNGRMAVSPLYFLDPAERKEVKKIAGIEGSFICNRKFHLCLYIIGAIACIAALCLSLYFLFLVSQSLALASVATIASGGSTCLLFKACSGIYGLYDESTIVTDPDAMQLFKNGLAPT
ncbi:ankyrin repeat domain-containing protein [Candidatus Wolbachia massiliensis]|uniref:Ankyrin repeat domain-containing protein n=1 Tax=Candidatus Wolbachia massiliensis TaxID=1845000 RepID=A0A7M3U2C8_9RICK|nr:ankyrin repeat domain-containing protein [Candidatus Wolbachia massiliensis]QOD38563.1 ankyrin repeat domain-containing protein [Candidatus Wolbachia massiliensis]